MDGKNFPNMLGGGGDIGRFVLRKNTFRVLLIEGRSEGIGNRNYPEISLMILGIPRKSWTEVGQKREKTKKHLPISR